MPCGNPKVQPEICFFIIQLKMQPEKFLLGYAWQQPVSVKTCKNGQSLVKYMRKY